MKRRRAVDEPPPFWAISEEAVIGGLASSRNGLANEEAEGRRGNNGFGGSRAGSARSVLLRQFRSPIVLILIVAASLSFILQDATDAAIILTVVALSAALGFWQEYKAANAVEKLRQTVQVTARVLREGRPVDVPTDAVVPGDIVLLSAGSIIPADCRLLEARDLFLNNAAMTGESFPVEAAPAILPVDTPLAGRTNCAYMGAHVVSGSGKAIATRVGRNTEFGGIASRLRLRPPETEFERGVRRFGNLLAEITLLLTLGIFAINVYLQKPVLESFLFALALAVGLTPQLLPAIISINLAHGARRMAARKVIVKHLAAIENFGSMNVLCSDKTGTVTEGIVRVHAALDAQGRDSPKTLLYAWLNATQETGFVNPIDEAIRSCPPPQASGWRKLDEIPYDFERRRLSILFEKDGRRIVITKGALREILDVCRTVEVGEDSAIPVEEARAGVEQQLRQMSDHGMRLLGVATRDIGVGKDRITRGDERDMVFVGFLALADPPKAGISETIGELAGLGVRLKIITGDNALIAAHVARGIGLRDAAIVSGPDLVRMSDQALIHRVAAADVFAEIEPAQKERIILALKKGGSVVGYIGDGINDASALHAADVSISVDGAVDVAREAADFVLLDRDLEVLVEGVREGRRTFANTLKYVFIATSANFGNMFSMAGASLLVPFLPLLPKQILLINLLTDIPEMTIAGDNVDAEWVAAPRRWDIGFIRRFMIVFGLVSSVFDFLTFAVLLHLGASVAQFRTGWFIESIVSAATIVLVVRTRQSLFASRPSAKLMLATGVVVCVALLTPWFPGAAALGFAPLPAGFYGVIGLIVLLYASAAEIAKRLFYRHGGGRVV